MQKFKIKPVTTLVAQSPAGVEVDAIVDNGILYLPVADIKQLVTGGSSDEDEDEKPKKSAPKPAKEEKTKPEKDSDEDDDHEYTEKELSDLSPKELQAILKERGIEIPKEGKNTNKKLRDLILADQEDGDGDSDKETADDEDEDEKPKKKSTKDDDDEDEPEGFEAVADILEKLDGGELTAKKAVGKILDAVEHDNEEHIADLVAEFEKGDDDIEDVARKICISPKAKGKKGATDSKKKGAKKLVEISDLKVGDKVNVFWKSEDDWFKGEVTAVKRGKVTVSYEDETDEALDPKDNTEIELL